MENKKAGIIVARFQVPKLHEGHRKLIDIALEECDKVWIFLGIPKERNETNPLTYEIRKDMIREIYKDENKLIINPLWDKESYIEWCSNLGNYLEILEKTDWEIILYGSRDSYLSATFKYKQRRIEEISNISGTQDRFNLFEYIPEMNTENFRKGIIHTYMRMQYDKNK